MKRRYNITLTPEMDEKLNRFAYLTRKSRSSLIEEALEQYLIDSGTDLRSPEGDEIAILKERLEVLEAKLNRIDRIDGHGQVKCPCPSSDTEYHDRTPQLLPQTPPPRVSKKIDPDTSPDEEIQSVIAIDPDGWYTQSLVSEFLDQSVLQSTRKSIVSLAVARGEMETNGKKRKGCRIKGSSAIRWIISMRKKEKPPVFFLGSP